jgi:tetratricopeptide (TPR) repeat protein
VCLLWAVPVQQVRGEEAADQVWDFANHLYRKQDFYRALSEYKRFIFLFPSDGRASEAELQIGRCYRYGGELEKAYDHFVQLFNRRSKEQVGRQALLEIIAIREEQERYSEGIYWVTRFIEHYPDASNIDDVYMLLAWLLIGSGDYEQAVATLNRIPERSEYHSTVVSLSQALRQRPDLSKKSPTLAGAMSAVLPGSGLLYTGRPGEAATSFLLNAIFIAGAVVAFENDSPVLGGILIFFELGWYVGGIRSAADAAREENKQKEVEYHQELEEKYRISLGLEPGIDRLAMSVRFSF